MQTCKTCRFYNSAITQQRPVSLNGSGEQGHCRLHPPVTMVVGMTQDLAGRATPAFVAVRPVVDADDWCGEHKPIAGPNDPLIYDGSRGEFNRMPTPADMEQMAREASSYRLNRPEDPPYGGTD